MGVKGKHALIAASFAALAQGGFGCTSSTPASRADSAANLTMGACKRDVPQNECTCPEEYDPVCGRGGRTHSNACFAGCVDAAIVHLGKCEDGNPCNCTDDFAPVCSEGHTFINECAAACADTSPRN